VDVSRFMKSMNQFDKAAAGLSDDLFSKYFESDIEAA
jgi:hypothetical protein